MNNVVTAGYGKSEPIAVDSIASGHAQNRRVELVVSGNAVGINAASHAGRRLTDAIKTTVETTPEAGL
jgi:hypothetical protein